MAKYAENLQNELEFPQSEKIMVHLCAYQINKSGKEPFLQFYLLKYLPTHELDFPKISRYCTTDKPTDIMEFVEEIIVQIFNSYSKTENMYQYKGVVQNENNYYYFYDCSDYLINDHLLSKCNDIWLVLMDEIMNQQSTCNFTISDSVQNFFSLFPEFVYLKNEENIIYETPIVVYTGCTKKKVEFISTFGVSPNLPEDPYYHFTNYSESIHLAINKSINEPTNFGCIIRFAIFPGNMVIIKERKSIVSMDENTDSYFYLENGTPYWVLKEYIQQSSLSYHYIDKSKEDNYFIV
jgi:hypothetical protein